MSYEIFGEQVFEKFNGETFSNDLMELFTALKDPALRVLETSPLLQGFKNTILSNNRTEEVLRSSHYSIDYVPIVHSLYEFVSYTQNKFILLRICHPEDGTKISPSITLEEILDAGEDGPEVIAVGCSAEITVAVVYAAYERILMKGAFPKELGDTAIPIKLSDVAQQMFELDYIPEQHGIMSESFFTDK